MGPHPMLIACVAAARRADLVVEAAVARGTGSARLAVRLTALRARVRRDVERMQLGPAPSACAAC